MYAASTPSIPLQYGLSLRFRKNSWDTLEKLLFLYLCSLFLRDFTMIHTQSSYSFIRKSVPDDIKVRDDDFSSKQGSLCTFKIKLIRIKKLKHNINIFCVNSIDRQMRALVTTFGQIDTSEYYVAPELEGSGTFLGNTLYY